MKKPESAYLAIQYEAIASGKFSPTRNGVGSVDEPEREGAVRLMFDRINGRDDQRNPQLLVRLSIEVPVASVAEARQLAEADWAPVAPGTCAHTKLRAEIVGKFSKIAHARPVGDRYEILGVIDQDERDDDVAIYCDDCEELIADHARIVTDFE